MLEVLSRKIVLAGCNHGTFCRTFENATTSVSRKLGRRIRTPRGHSPFVLLPAVTTRRAWGLSNPIGFLKAVVAISHEHKGPLPVPSRHKKCTDIRADQSDTSDLGGTGNFLDRVHWAADTPTTGEFVHFCGGRRSLGGRPTNQPTHTVLPRVIGRTNYGKDTS
jgi:hypothetical protein